MRLPRRFDDGLMAPPEAGTPADPILTAALRRWCEEGAFAASPAPCKPLLVARVADEAGVDDAALALDGSHALARLGRLRGLAWRLTLLARECLTSGRARAQDPWDAGWWRAASLDAAASFRPRRPTLLMVREAHVGALPALLAALSDNSDNRDNRDNSARFSEPVRVLVVSSTPIDGVELLRR